MGEASKFILCVAGSRNLTPPDKFVSVFTSALLHVMKGYGLKHVRELEIIAGDQRGVDRWVQDFAKRISVEFQEYPADWNSLGHAAGPLRNSEMADVAEYLIAFPGGKGTINMIGQMKKRQKPWLQLKWEDCDDHAALLSRIRILGRSEASSVDRKGAT